MKVEREVQLARFGDKAYVVEVERRELCIPLRMVRVDTNAGYPEDYEDVEPYTFPEDSYRRFGAYKRLERENKR